MAFTQTDVVAKAIALGGLDASLTERVTVTAEMTIAKTSIYLGYDCTKIDALLNVLAEITVTQLSQYQNLMGNGTGATKRISRGDYTVEYDTDRKSVPANDGIFDSYTWILKTYKKLRSL